MSDDDMGMQQELPEGQASMPGNGMEQLVSKRVFGSVPWCRRQERDREGSTGG